MMLLYFAAL